MQEWFSSKASQQIQNYNKSKDVKVENECVKMSVIFSLIE